LSVKHSYDSDFTTVGAFEELDFYVSDFGSTISFKAGLMPRGKNNIQYAYRAGYELASVPSDIKHAVLMLAEWYYYMNQRKDIGRSSKSKSGESETTSSEIPSVIREIAQRYKRYDVPVVNDIRLA
jgi:hypothetical protein